MKYIFEPVSFYQAQAWLEENSEKHLLLDVDGLSITIGEGFTIQQMNELINIPSKSKISLLVNRIFHEKDFAIIKELLETIDVSKITYFIYSDLGFYQFAKEYGLVDKLVYDAYTYLTNFEDVNLYADMNQAVVVSNQISFDELVELTKKVHKKAFVHAFGKSVIFYSKRKLLTNYFTYRKLENQPYSKEYFLQEEFRHDFYHLFEDENGSYIFEKGFYYLMDELNALSNISFAIVHCGDLDEHTYQLVVDAYESGDEQKLLALPIDVSKGIMEKSSVLFKERGNG